MRVLVIDSDSTFVQRALRALERAAIDGRAVTNARDARRILSGTPESLFDLVLLEAELPGPTGWELLAALRARGCQVPVIFVTRRTEVARRVRGLELGADDYMIKPLELEELLARVQAVLRRHARQHVEVGDLRIHLTRRRVESTRGAIDLSPREFDLLLCLASGGGRTVSRQELARQVWNLDSSAAANVIDVYMTRLRKKLALRCRARIETVPRVGYRLR